MSKSLGNSPDPLELIAGADALRFGTMRSAPLGQDVLFDEKDVELGRNFCNKLWNACCFARCRVARLRGRLVPAHQRYRWIRCGLAKINEVTAAFEVPITDATATLTGWSEYCEWYIESCKDILRRGRGSPPFLRCGLRHGQYTAPVPFLPAVHHRGAVAWSWILERHAGRAGWRTTATPAGPRHSIRISRIVRTR